MSGPSGWARLDAALADVEAPLAAVDAGALDANAADLVRRAAGLPIRIATKSVRVRGVLDHVLARPGFSGLMAYALDEAIWLARAGATDVLVAYPTADRTALRTLARDPVLRAAVTVTIDHPAHLALIAEAVGDDADARVRVCLDVDASLRVGPLHLGARRSPVHSVDQAVDAARAIAAAPCAELVGLMFYDAQLAGVPDSSVAVAGMKRVSARELRARRAAVVERVRAITPLAFVNGGGTGSLDVIGHDGLTEVAAGSGLYGPTLFDGYRGFQPRPALAYALPVVRKPAPDLVTVFSGGFVASGPVGASRNPTPVHPAGLRLVGGEGAGEVQTPLRGPAARDLRIGDRVWWRHAKAGEVLERFAAVHVVDGDDVTVLPTYRGEGMTFG